MCIFSIWNNIAKTFSTNTWLKQILRLPVLIWSFLQSSNGTLILQIHLTFDCIRPSLNVVKTTNWENIFYLFRLWVYIFFTSTPLYNVYKIFYTSFSTWQYDRNRVFVRILFSLMLHFDILKMSLSEKGKQGYIKVLKFSHVIFVFHIRM